MVVENPLFTHWTVRKFKSTVMYAIWQEVLFFSTIATIVTLVSDLTPHKLSISNTMLTVLGIVLGLVISFRTSSAYERYMEGSKLWTTVKVCSRNLAQIIWIHVPFERTDANGQQLKSELEIAIEKKSMINLVQAVPVAIKHLLRGERGVDYDDLSPLVRFLPRYSTDVDQDAIGDHMASKTHRTSFSSSPVDSVPRNALDMLSEDRIVHTVRGPRRSETAQGKLARNSDPELALSAVDSAGPLQSAPNPSRSIFSCLHFWRPKGPPLEASPRSTGTTQHILFTGKPRPKPKAEAIDSNVPLEITLCLSSYLAWLLKQNQLQPTIASAFIAAITTLQDTVTNLDRIRDMPLPFAYQVHLRTSLWLYLFFLPFQVWSSFGYLTIPGTAFVSFLLLGFLEIGHEIENPFDYDLNDLDLDMFCLTIQREVNEIVAHPCPDPDQFLFTRWNQPFAPSDTRTAEEIIKSVDDSYRGPDGGMHGIRRTLLKNWWNANQIATPAAV